MIPQAATNPTEEFERQSSFEFDPASVSLGALLQPFFNLDNTIDDHADSDDEHPFSAAQVGRAKNLCMAGRYVKSSCKATIVMTPTNNHRLENKPSVNIE